MHDHILSHAYIYIGVLNVLQGKTKNITAFFNSATIGIHK